jgi:hypothetical protein
LKNKNVFFLQGFYNLQDFSQSGNFQGVLLQSQKLLELQDVFGKYFYQEYFRLNI